MDKLEFKECAICASKGGSPILCPSCLNNRSVINILKHKDVTFKDLFATYNKKLIDKWNKLLDRLAV